MDDGVDVELEAWLESRERFEPPGEFVEQANVTDPSIYEAFEENWPACWERAADLLDWETDYEAVLDDSGAPRYRWFVDGRLNAAHNCIDRHVEAGRKNHAAIRWEGKRGETETYTYGDLKRETEAFGAALRELGVGEDDVVTLYLPMIPELPIAMLACARIGAPHSVVFAGFSPDALATRMDSADSQFLVTCDGYYRRGDALNHKGKADRAVRRVDHDVETVVVDRLGGGLPHSLGDRQHDYDALVTAHRSETVEPVARDSEDDLFVMYTSGTTGEPKAVRHTTGGYLAHVAWTTHAVLDVKPEDTYWCSADIGWITGHSYIVYGPLALGATTIIYEGTPDYPEKDRIWELVERYGVDVFYTAPTAVRAFMKWGSDHPESHDLSSLRLLGTVGEPINPKAWKWYYEHIGGGSCPVVDTWWQAETGGMMITTLPGIGTMKPGAAGPPLPGIDARVVDADGQEVAPGEAGYLVVEKPWPGMLRGLAGDDERFVSEYWEDYSDPELDEWAYFAGDGAKVDDDGYVTLLGRVDDVIDVAGHRLGTMELESAIVGVEGVAEAAAVEAGGDLLAYVSTEREQAADAVLRATVTEAVEAAIGEVAVPDHVVFTPELPKTRSGKIMRRLLEDIATGEELGDISALRNPEIVGELRARLAGETRSYLESDG
ncbi:acetate--CoA ligase [Natronomonas marina]|jgi:acetyl-CoA synthetase|uniref:acetate--CoA ligase n=1 Tax=Natronomonas marina TaxID=2961939 RepID=UPI0020C9D335|nr:acetate--CoA ligase [Natronomonas marina]